MKNGQMFLSGVFISRLGDSFSFLAFVLLLTANGKSNQWISLFMVAHYLPGVLIGVWGRGWFDRIPKRSVLVICYLVSALLTFAAIFSTSSPMALLILSVLLGISYGFYVPLQRALVAEVFPPDAVQKANSSVQSAEGLAKTLGFMLAGLTFHHLGPTASFLLDGISFILIAALLTRLKLVPSQRASFRPREQSLIIQSKPNPALLYASALFALAWLGTGSLFALEAGYARTYLNASETVIGALFACATLGSFIAPYLVSRLKKTTDVSDLVVSAFGEMCFVAGYACSSSVLAALLWIIGYGTLLTMRHIILATWIHRSIPKEEQGSAFALQQGMANLMMMIGMGLSGPLSEYLGVRTIILLAAVLSQIGILIIGLRLIGNLRSWHLLPDDG